MRNEGSGDIGVFDRRQFVSAGGLAVVSVLAGCGERSRYEVGFGVLWDYAERYEYMTDPEATVTYGITREHQERIVEPLAEGDNSWTPVTSPEKTVEAIWIVRNAGSMRSLELNDTSDDFDFVTVSGSTVSGRLTFRARDNQIRTDTWLSNRAEVALEIDPHDPDTDNDGLTDGQEVKWVTRERPHLGGIRPDSSVNGMTNSPGLGTSPRLEDSDGDGYWDGWLGVYNASNSTNVVLYMAHLRNDDDGDGDTTDDGLAPDERVPEQAGVHSVSAAPSAMGAEVTGGRGKEHSNLHIGELQWGTNPTAGGDVPTPSLSVEVDYYNGTDYEPLDTASWEAGIEGNYALYGIKVEIVRDDVFDDDDLVVCSLDGPASPCVDPSDGFGYSEIIRTSLATRDEGTDEHVLVVNNGDGQLSERQTGVNLALGVTTQALFSDGLQRSSSHLLADRNNFSDHVANSQYHRNTSYVAAVTQIHEIGHALNIGRADDIYAPKTLQRNAEIYSGEGPGRDGYYDPTPENLDGAVKSWSVMASGYGRAGLQPMSGRYFAFSVEELSSVEP